MPTEPYIEKLLSKVTGLKETEVSALLSIYLFPIVSAQYMLSKVLII
jgi:hypothetical protein